MTKLQKDATRKVLVFLDIDGTLLNPNYQTNSELLPRVIKRLSNRQYIFCLNSNRAIEDLKPLAKKFNIKGPIIAENGTFMVMGNRTQMFTQVAPIREKLDCVLKTIEKNENVKIYKIDTVKSGKRKTYAQNKVLLVNKFREYTGSIHVRHDGQNDLAGAAKLAKQLKREMGKEYAISTSSVFANVLISPKSTDKGKALQILKKEYFPNSTIVMIGDDSADMPVMNVVDKFYAVGNAEQQVKRRADFRAKRPYTQGVVEILTHLDVNGIK